jgi:DNA repair protein RadB
MLKKLSQKYNIPVVITNQVYDDLKHENNVLPLGGNGTRHSLKASLKFEKEENGIRIATINRHRSLPEGVTCQFKIENSGLISLDDVEIPDEINNTDDDEFRFLT